MQAPLPRPLAHHFSLCLRPSAGQAPPLPPHTPTGCASQPKWGRQPLLQPPPPCMGRCGGLTKEAPITKGGHRGVRLQGLWPHPWACPQLGHHPFFYRAASPGGAAVPAGRRQAPQAPAAIGVPPMAAPSACPPLTAAAHVGNYHAPWQAPHHTPPLFITPPTSARRLHPPSPPEPSRRFRGESRLNIQTPDLSLSPFWPTPRLLLMSGF